MNQPSPHSAFAPTRWTLVLRARGETPEGRAALAELCELYYQPVVRFLHHEGRDEDAARELGQEFFARLLSGGGLSAADPERGRFRSYLLGALKHLLADQRKHERRLKRGGSTPPEPLDLSSDSDSAPALQIADPTAVTPDSVFDREWALAVMGRALAVVEKEFVEAGKADQFTTLKPWLMGEAVPLSQLEAGRQLGLSEGAIKVVIHRMRKRFREVVRGDIGQTVRDPALVDEELRHLIDALS